MVEMNHTMENWGNGDAYERYVGRWSQPVACEFLDWLAVPAGRSWLDVGCGTGKLSHMIADFESPAGIHCIDSSVDYVAYARAHRRDARFTFVVGDAASLPYHDDSFDAVVSGLVLNFVPRPVQAVREMSRAARPAGVVAAYVWDYAGRMDLMRYFWDAAVSLDPTAKELDEGHRFPLCQPQPLHDLFRTAGLENVETRSIDVPTRFRDFDDYWFPFLGGQGPAPGYAMSLTEDRRAMLRERIRESLQFEEDGSIHLIARAWAVRGTSRVTG